MGTKPSRTSVRAKRYLDTESGEVFRLVNLDRQLRSTTDKEPPFAMVYQPALMELTRCTDLTLSEWRVLMWLVAKAPLGERIDVNQSRIARDLSIHPITAHRTFHALIDRDYVVADDDEPGTYWVNPEIALLGNRADRDRVREHLGRGCITKG